MKKVSLRALIRAARRRVAAPAADNPDDSVSIGEDDYESDSMIDEPPLQPIFYQTFEGDNERCSICQFEVVDGEACGVLPCNHYFHEHCINDHIASKDEQPICPNCRGPFLAE